MKEFLHFKLLKGKRRFISVTKIWKDICSELNWPFERSI